MKGTGECTFVCPGTRVVGPFSVEGQRKSNTLFFKTYRRKSVCILSFSSCFTPFLLILKSLDIENIKINFYK